MTRDSVILSEAKNPRRADHSSVEILRFVQNDSAPAQNHSALAQHDRRRLPLFASVICLLFLLAGERSEAGEQTGSIRGMIDGDGALPTTVVAVDRKTRKRHPGTVDAESRAFEISGLRIDVTYDCVLDFKDGVRLEGINLHVPPSDYVEEQPLSKEDVEPIRGKVQRMNRFEDVVEIKTIQGNIQHAAILINKLRTKPFFGSKPGEVIWRAELWHFERPEETWVKVQDELFIVLYRERIQHAVFRKKSLTFDSALGGLKPSDKEPIVDLGDVEAPDIKPGIRLRTIEPEPEAAGDS